jgi:tripartite-type tricarboxylate transporter receptor subunit TctC
MVEYAKKNPGKLTFASSGSGTSTHLRLEMLKLKAGIDILHVPYRESLKAAKSPVKQGFLRWVSA